MCNRAGTGEYAEVPSPLASVFWNLSLRCLLIEPRVPEYPSSEQCMVRLEQGVSLGGLVVGVMMQAWGTMMVILTLLMVATVDTKIYGRCNLAMKLEEAGLNGFLGYSIGDCETPIAPCPVHTPSRPPHSDPGPSLSFITSPGQGIILLVIP